VPPGETVPLGPVAPLAPVEPVAPVVPMGAPLAELELVPDEPVPDEFVPDVLPGACVPPPGAAEPPVDCAVAEPAAIDANDMAMQVARDARRNISLTGLACGVS
jgi:hypothetical protein